MRRKVSPEQATTGVPYPYENSYTQGPNPAPNLHTAYFPNPYRLHSPVVDDSNHEISADPSNAVYQRVYPVRPIAYQALPPISRFVDTPGLQAPVALMRRGWQQSYVPEPGMHAPLPIEIPALILSQPIRYDMSPAIEQPIRVPTKGKAPKAH